MTECYNNVATRASNQGFIKGHPFMAPVDGSRPDSAQIFSRNPTKFRRRPKFRRARKVGVVQQFAFKAAKATRPPFLHLPVRVLVCQKTV
jgi:hypothetical protein